MSGRSKKQMKPARVAGTRSVAMRGRRWIVLTGAALATMTSTLWPLAAAAQDYPQKPVKLVAPFPAGGITDALTRIMADELAKSLNQSVVVENRGGASGSIGLSYVLSQPADGYTVIMGGNGPSAIVPALNENVRYAPKDFEPVAYVAALPSVLVVHPSVPAKTLEQFIAYAKAQGEQLSCASHGPGSFNHLACVQFNRLTGSRLTHVPYKGAAPVVVDLLPGRVQVYFAVLPSVLEAIRSGKLVALATGEDERVRSIPEVPTMKEAGLPGLRVSSWNALYVRTGTPEPIVRTLRERSAEILKRADVIARIDATGSIAKPIAPAELGRMTEDEYQAFRRLAREENIRIE